MTDNDQKDSIAQAVDWINQARRVVALTGAGLSVDSGIPDFRSSSGLWERFDPMEYATIDAFHSHPEKVWEMIGAMNRLLDRADPNPGHFGLARLEKAGKLQAIITQNIDNLHQEAGNTNVIEFHGNGRRLVCLECRRSFSIRTFPADRIPPRCNCGRGRTILKPDVIFFGEMIPAEANLRAHQEARTCDVMLVVGTSAVVMPAADLPAVARRSGSKVIEINLEETPLTGAVAHLSIRGSTSEILPRLADHF